MTPVDRDVLELLRNGDESELVLTPGVIAANTDWKRQTIREHLLRLSDERLVEYYDEARALYQLTDRGRRYLRGDVAVEALEADD
ncbi:ArsR family transcriptional regulator [Halorientalis pallida]|uniref:ArsR family transcriptional regulator n=2 Tax=Halorientalis pallida TaxID=2479928 RepID=A0A498KXH9_9EURY|nr:ArsR family transcriptional regulator [Halorientalis pallida]